MIRSAAALCALLVLSLPLAAESPPAPAPADPALAKRLGADEYGMRPYVLVILKTGPNRMPEGEARKAMFAGHFANIKRLADEGKLAVAGPFGQNEDGWRGLFLMATASPEEARSWTEADPVIVNGEMVAEYVPWYGSAALMQVAETHEKISVQSP
ncbi:YciI family protein [Pseudomarimonas salicorniae]|uniref:YciI family protein n=1 Tax=Pseudomarimonas salicorniae TaxID=2933270 RepID=A0ABT0GK45_9GAMM|nr:YciI family protein [Lysobacter sp. CAU 1642]MCK7594908.1 YciI family protein [Lysobacter sp. CAU 1642]